MYLTLAKICWYIIFTLIKSDEWLYQYKLQIVKTATETLQGYVQKVETFCWNVSTFAHRI